MREHRRADREAARSAVGETEVADELGRMLDFTFETARPVLVEGDPRTGKSWAAKAFCEVHPGEARYILTPPGTGERELYRAVADAIGAADGECYNAGQIRERVEEVLRRSR